MESLGFRASSPSLATAFASLFLHWNVFHLLGNMLFIAVVGSAVEIALGWWRYLVVYLFGGLSGVLVHWAFQRFSTESGVLVGASACVAACIAFAAIRYGTKKVPLSGKIQIPVLAVIAVWIALQSLGMVVRLGDSSGGTGFVAHVGGLMFGLAMTFVFGAAATAELADAHEQLRTIGAEGPDASLVAARAILERNPSDPIALAQAADAAQALGDRALEIDYRLRQVPLPIGRLCSLGALSQISALERMKLVATCDPASKVLVLKSVAQESGPEQPNAILELIALEPNGGWQEKLASEFALHPSMEIARARGLV